jgi:hypothetical protein
LVMDIQERRRGEGRRVGTVSCAFTGLAATNLLHGMTILSMLGIPMHAPSQNEDLPILSNLVRLLAISNLFKYEQSDQVRLLFIDEISLVTPEHCLDPYHTGMPYTSSIFL